MRKKVKYCNITKELQKYLRGCKPGFNFSRWMIGADHDAKFRFCVLIDKKYEFPIWCTEAMDGYTMAYLRRKSPGYRSASNVLREIRENTLMTIEDIKERASAAK